MRIRYGEIDGFIKILNGVRCIVLIDCGWFDRICDRIKYLISEKKNGITDRIHHNFAKIRID